LETYKRGEITAEQADAMIKAEYEYQKAIKLTENEQEEAVANRVRQGEITAIQAKQEIEALRLKAREEKLAAELAEEGSKNLIDLKKKKAKKQKRQSKRRARNTKSFQKSLRRLPEIQGSEALQELNAYRLKESLQFRKRGGSGMNLLQQQQPQAENCLLIFM